MSERTLLAEASAGCSHTPGPWTAEVSDLLGIIVYAEPCQSMVAVLNAKGAEGASWDSNIERQAGNARLIAAAPDLLAALTAMDSALCDGFDTQATRMAGRKALIAARAAIAKAEGRS